MAIHAHGMEFLQAAEHCSNNRSEQKSAGHPFDFQGNEGGGECLFFTLMSGNRTLAFGQGAIRSEAPVFHFSPAVESPEPLLASRTSG